jgi:DNA polymerase epsilon subunit 2
LFSEGCFALVEGEYTEEATLEIIAIGQPPCEPRLTARCVFLLLNNGKDFKCVSRSIYGHIDFLGKGATSLLEDVSILFSVSFEPNLP